MPYLRRHLSKGVRYNQSTVAHQRRHSFSSFGQDHVYILEELVRDVMFMLTLLAPLTLEH